MAEIYHLTGIYLDAREQRANELCDALEMNVANLAIAEVHMLVEENPDAFFAALEAGERAPDARMAKLMQSPKVVVSVLGRCAQYQDFFDYAAERLDGRIVALANADIGLTESIQAVYQADFSDSFLCISRREYIWRPGTCQDVWVFRAPLRCRAEWAFGYPGSEVKLAYEVEQQGYRLCNPSPVIEVRHFHWSQKRRYRIPEDIIPGPHRDTYPSDLRPVRPDRPKGTKAVVTTKVEELKDVYWTTKRHIASYAKKINADLVEIPDGPGKHMLSVFDKYERVIYLEPDVLVHPDAPDLFDLVPERHFGALNESHYLGRKWLEPWSEEYEKYDYAPDSQMEHWNTNVMVVDIWNAFLFDNLPGAYDRRMGCGALKGGPFPGAIHRDEIHMAVLARHFNIPIFEYHVTFNYKLETMERPKPKPFFINLKDVPLYRRFKAAQEEEALWKS